jgi:hypothetical protein
MVVPFLKPWEGSMNHLAVRMLVWRYGSVSSSGKGIPSDVKRTPIDFFSIAGLAGWSDQVYDHPVTLLLHDAAGPAPL